MRRSALFGLAALALVTASPGAAQQPTPQPAAPGALSAADLPPEVVARVTAFFNDPETLHFTGRTRIPPEAVIRGDVAVLGGPLLVAGRIEGSVVVINGSVELLPGGVVTGGITVVGGGVTGLAGARVEGEVLAYAERLRYERSDDRIAALEADTVTGGDLWPAVREDEEGGWAIGGTEGEGRQDFVVATGQSYNRVEGLPITFGPVVETGGRNPTRLRASAIYRTEEGFALGPGRWGYDVRLEQFVGGRGDLRVGAALRSVVDPIEAWHLSKLENGLSTFFLHRDYRDHYERKGWSAFTTLAPRDLPVSLTAEFRSEDHHSVPSGSPWTLFDNDEPWRPQPLVAEGRFKSLSLRGVFDTRSEPEDPASGWYVQGGVEHSLDTDLVRPEALAGLAGTVVPAERFGDFVTGMVDIRRYNRISPTSRLNLRVLAGGSLDGSRLPPQRQHALGGEGSLPGYGLFSLDCQSRGERVFRAGDVDEDRGPDDLPASYVAGYGCDRFALFQAEYRGKLRFSFRWNDTGDTDPADGATALESELPGRLWNADFSWVAFVDAGGGWAVGRDAEERTVVDVGFGLLLGTVGVYGAFPLEGGDGVNLFVRLAPRF